MIGFPLAIFSDSFPGRFNSHWAVKATKSLSQSQQLQNPAEVTGVRCLSDRETGARKAEIWAERQLRPT